MIPLTYLAQVRQIFPLQPLRRGAQILFHVFTTRPFLPTKPRAKHGMSRKEIVIIGTVPDVGWEEQNRSTEEWLTVVECWQIITRFTL